MALVFCICAAETICSLQQQGIHMLMASGGLFIITCCCAPGDIGLARPNSFSDGMLQKRQLYGPSIVSASVGCR